MLGDLKSEVRGASMGVDDLLSRIDSGEVSAKDLEVDLGLQGQELDELENKVDRAKAELEDQGLATDAAEQLWQQIAQSREALQGGYRALDDLPVLSAIDQASEATPAPEPTLPDPGH